MIHSSSSASEQEGLPRLIFILRDRWRAIAICMFASFVIAAAGYVGSPVRFTSEVILALDVRKLQALPTESVVSPLPQESPVLRTELDIISSQSMAQRVLDILQKSEVAGEIETSRNAGAVPLAMDLDVYPDLTGSRSADDRTEMVEELMKNVRVMNDGRSYTIYISYSARDPVYAARVANTFGEAYIDYQIDLQTSATRRVAEWLGERVANLRVNLEQSEKQAVDFRSKVGLTDNGGISLQAQRLSGLNVELTSLQARLAGSKARLATALDVQASGNGLGLNEVLSSPSIQLLRAEQARVIRAIDEIDESGARMNPALPQLTSQLASLGKQVDQEISQVISALRNEIEINEKQQQQVEASLKSVQSDIAENTLAAVQSAQLDRETTANRSIYETYLTRYKQTIEQDGIATAEARIISPAVPSTRPASPDKLLWGLLAVLLGSGSGIATAIVLNFTDTSIRSMTALQQKTGLAVIGKIPRIPSDKARNRSGMFIGDATDFLGSLADLQTYMQLAEDKARVIAFTSSLDQEGKTFVVANLARSLASSGVNLIVVDANLRDPGINLEFDVQSNRHLSSAIKQETSFDDLIQHDLGSSVDVIVAKQNEIPPNIVLGSKRFAALIVELRQRYELVLIDAPSVAYDLDLLRIATLADTIVLVVRQDIAKAAEIQNAVTKLRLAGRHITGIVLNGVVLPRHNRRQGWFKAAVQRKPAPRATTPPPTPQRTPASVQNTR